MFSHRLSFPVLALLAVGCVGTVGTDSSEGLGQTSLPLQATTASGVLYRLTKATFVIKDATCNRVVATVKADPNKVVQNVTLRPGTYKITLSDGWLLQRQDGTSWVDATGGKLTGLPTANFKIKARETVTLTYAFGFDPAAAVTSTAAVPLNPLARTGCDGTARIAMTVADPPAPAVDCSLYGGKISALAAFTIDCLGTLNASQYLLQTDGHLARNFQQCISADPFPEPNGPDSRIASIDGILSLQYPRPDLDGFPEAAAAIASNQIFSDACIAVKWSQWAAGPQPNVCPTWQLVSADNPPGDAAYMKALGANLPPKDKDAAGAELVPPTVPATPAAVVAAEKQTYFYSVSFPDGSPEPNCGSVDQCATACAGGFLGFVSSTDGSVVVADPAYWELGDRYPAGTDPFLSAGYYHAMADYGPVPGDQFGHVARARQINTDGQKQGEACTYYIDGTRFYTSLMESTNSTGSVSWCKAPGAVIF